MKKLHLDANVVIRFLVGKPEDMAEKSRQLMEKAEQGQVRLKLPLIVLAEVYWVLFSYYEFSRSRIGEVLSEFIKAQGIQAEDESMALEALSLAAKKNVDFVDAFLASSANNQNNAVVTFDENDFERMNVDWENPGEI